MSEAVHNIAEHLVARAAERPQQIALWLPHGQRDGVIDYRSVSYAELDAGSNRIASALLASGISPGTRCAVMLRPGFDFFAVMFALFKAGLVPVLIDPGIARPALRQCLAEASPEVFIGIPLAQAASIVLGWARGSLKRRITAGPRWFWGGATLAELRAGGSETFNIPPTDPDSVAAILFTSGSTGVPKGVVYRHRHFAAQVSMLREALGVRPGDVNLPTFPPFALFDPALGMTSVIPQMDPTRPAKADPRSLIAAIERFGVTTLFGSPALLDTLSRHTRAESVRLGGVRCVMSAGAPVPIPVIERMFEALPPDARLYTPYGATECLPVAVIEGRELLGEVRVATETGAGTCVGFAVPPNEVRIIAIRDAAIDDWSGVQALAPDRIGEITVAGPSATDSYFRRDAATCAAKIRERLDDGNERVVHRMGDLGRIDAQGRLWFCGRKSQRVNTPHSEIYTECVEPIFNTLPEVRRCALVGVGERGAQRAVLCVELEAGVSAEARERIEAELLNMAQHHAHTREIETVLFRAELPVDIRHNAKIGREQLALWAARELGTRGR